MNNSGEENEKNNELLIQESEQSNITQNDSENNKYNAPSNETKSNEDNYNKKKEFVVLNLDAELKDVDKTNKVKDKTNVFHVICKGEKRPTTWVQFNQVYEKASPHFGDYGEQSGGGMDYDPSTRNQFVKFVFMILLIMLIITAGFCIIVLSTTSLKNIYRRAGLLILIICLCVLLVMNFVMVCVPMARVAPCNIISLIIVVIASSNLLAAITVKYKTHILLLAVISTVILVAICVLLACTSFDFTKWYIYMVVIATVFMAISLVVAIVSLTLGIKYKPLQLAMSFIGSLIHSIILIMELQMILGGRAIELDETDYALGD